MDNSTIVIDPLANAFTPKEVGEIVNVHVVQFQPEPEPDFDQMLKLVAGQDTQEVG